MKRLFQIKNITTAFVIFSLVAGSSLTSTQAYAGQKHRYNKWGNQARNYQNHQRVVPKRNYRKRDRTGSVIAAGIVGLALGAIIVDSVNKRRRVKQYYNPPVKYNSSKHYNDYSENSYQRSYIPDEDTYIVPKGSEDYNSEDVITYEESASLEPWTPGWQEYCSHRYRSFNPQSGTYKGYDGLHHFCVAK